MISKFLQALNGYGQPWQGIQYDYFLKGINTPEWYWFFRVIFLAGLMLAVIVFFRSHGKAE